MNYKLIDNSLNDIYNIKETILLNRGIQDYKTYLNLTDDHLYHWNLLDNIEKAIQCLLKHIENKNEIHIIVDCDNDGYCSAAMLYKYLKLINSNIDLSYSIHTGKEHGISKDIQIPENTKLLLIPDASTNDYKQCAKLNEKGIDIIILDHHIADNNNIVCDHDAILINNQTCDYPNKNLCGSAIVYKFLQALDEELWLNKADQFLDLVALSLIADAMDIRLFETKRLIDKGLSQIQNKFFKALLKKQEYSIGRDITITNIAFYIVPLINGLIRFGDYEEKDLMFRAFIETDEIFKYKPRRKSKDDIEPEEINELIYDRVARLCVNAKARQNKSKEVGIEKICEYVEKNNLKDDKILFINGTKIVEKNLTGVVAMQTAAFYNKPCLILRKREDKDNIYGGSGRNINNGPIESLKDLLEETKMFELVSGHTNAMGIEIKKENIRPAINLINEKLKNIDFKSCWLVDFIVNNENLEINLIKEIDDMKKLFGQKLDEPKIVIRNLIINKNNIQLIGKNNDTWKIILDNGIVFIKFKNDETDLILKWLNEWSNEKENIIIDVIGKCGINNFGGVLIPQIIVLDYQEVG